MPHVLGPIRTDEKAEMRLRLLLSSLTCADGMPQVLGPIRTDEKAEMRLRLLLPSLVAAAAKLTPNVRFWGGYISHRHRRRKRVFFTQTDTDKDADSHR